MTQAWTNDVARYLLDATICPRCGTRLTEPFWCVTCHAVLSGSDAARVHSASRAAVSALELRDQYIAGLRTNSREQEVAAGQAAESAVDLDPAVASVPPIVSPREGSSVSVQSVLAVAGAALVAVAAIVFTFLNPDLTDFGTRTLIVGVVTAVFLGSAWMLVRTGLQFSAEAVGALGMVFVALDIWAFSSLAPAVSGWVFAGIGTLAGSVAMILIASLARIRTWLWAGLVGVTLSPAFFGYAAGDPWVAAFGHLGVGLVALLVPLGLHRLEGRFRSKLRVDRVTSTVIEFAVFAVVLAQTATLPRPEPVSVLGDTFILLALAALAAGSARNTLWRVWSFLAGGLVAAALGVAPYAFLSGEYLVALVPAVAAVALIVLAALPPAPTVHRPFLLIGAWSVTLAASVPSDLLAFSRAVLPIGRPSSVLLIGTVLELAAILGVAAVSLGSVLL